MTEHHQLNMDMEKLDYNSEIYNKQVKPMHN